MDVKTDPSRIAPRSAAASSAGLDVNRLARVTCTERSQSSTRTKECGGAGLRPHPPRPARRARRDRRAQPLDSSRRADPSERRQVGTIEQRRERARRAPQVVQQCAGDAEAALVAPFTVGVEPLEPVHGYCPIRPCELAPRGERMRGHAEAAQPSDILGHVVGFPTERIRRGRHPERNVVPAVRADLNRVQAQHTVEVNRRIRCSRAVAVVSDDGELKPGARGGGRDRVLVERPVRACGVDVKRAAHRLGCAGRGDRRGGARSTRTGDKNKDGGQCGRRQDYRECRGPSPALG